MVGYADNRPKDTYRMYLYESCQVVESRHVSWNKWEPKSVKDKMPGMFVDTALPDKEPETGIEEDSFLEISWLYHPTSTRLSQTQTQVITTQAPMGPNQIPVVVQRRPIPASPRVSLIPSPLPQAETETKQEPFKSSDHKALRPNARYTSIMTRSMTIVTSPVPILGRTWSQSQTLMSPTKTASKVEDLTTASLEKNEHVVLMFQSYQIPVNPKQYTRH